MRHDYHCFSNAVIGRSLRVCLGAKQLEQWYAYSRYFFAVASLSPLFAQNTQKVRLFCRLFTDTKTLTYRKEFAGVNSRLCYRGRKNQQGRRYPRVVRRGNNPTPARLALLALFYFFALIDSLFTDGANSSRLSRSLQDQIESHSPLHGSPLLFWPIVISEAA